MVKRMLDSTGVQTLEPTERPGADAPMWDILGALSTQTTPPVRPEIVCGDDEDEFEDEDEAFGDDDDFEEGEELEEDDEDFLEDDDEEVDDDADSDDDEDDDDEDF